MKKQGFLYGSVILMASAAAAKVLGALFKIPLANMLGGTGMGYFSCAYGVFMPVYALSVTGLPTAAAALTAENCACGHYSNVREIRKTALRVFGLLGIFSSLVMLLFSVPFCRYFAGSEYALPAVLMIAPAVLTGCLTAVYRGCFEGMRNMYPTALSQLVEGVVKLVCGLALCRMTLRFAERDPAGFAETFSFLNIDMSREEGVLSVAAAAAVSGITLSGIAGTVWLAVRLKLRGDGITAAELAADSHIGSRRETVRSLVKIAVPVAIGSLVTNLTSLIDLGTIIRITEKSAAKYPVYFSEICGGIKGAENIANFIFGSFTGLAVTIFNLIPSITNMFGKGIIPSAAEAWAEKNAEKLRKCTADSLIAAAAVAVPAGIGISVLAGPVLNVLFGSRPAETALSVLPLEVLGTGVIFLSLTVPAFSVMQASGMAGMPVRIMLIGVAVKLVLNCLLVPIPQLNVTGAAVSTAVCYGIMSVISVFILCRRTGISPGDIAVPLCGILFSGILCGAAAYACSMLISWNSELLRLAASVSAGGLAYAAAVFAQKDLRNRITGLAAS